MVQLQFRNIQVIVLVTLTVLKNTVLFVYQTGKKKKNGGEIIYKSKNILPEHKWEMKWFIYGVAKLLDSFF